MPYVYARAAPRKRVAKKKVVSRALTRKAPTVGGRSIRQTLLKTVPIFPVSKMCYGQLYYEPYLSRTASMGSYATYVFSANGAYDPNITSTGHQPMGFDQMMLFYEQFVVLRSHIKVTAICASESARVAIYLSPDTGALAPIPLMENGLVVTDTLVGSGTSDSGQHRMKTLELACDVPKYFGKTKAEIIADPQMYGTVAANPGEQVYFHITVWDPFSAATETSVLFDVTLSYDTYYWEPKKVANS